MAGYVCQVIILYSDFVRQNLREIEYKNGCNTVDFVYEDSTCSLSIFLCTVNAQENLTHPASSRFVCCGRSILLAQ